MYYNRFPFSIVLNDGVAFPAMPAGELLVYGKHDQAIARCDYDGNTDVPHPHAEEGETNRLVLLNNDRDSIMAWHGHREPANPEAPKNGRKVGRIDWVKAIKHEAKKAERKERKKNRNRQSG
jgi:hypothetical protein